MKNFDYSQEPGKLLEKKEYERKEPVVSVIIPFYNDKNYIEQSVNAILNQTFPLFELLIIDDGSKDEESLAKLEEVAKKDERIKVFHKENEGLSATRDYGAKQVAESTKYLVFCDSDDLLDKTFIECGYWTLETNKKAAWAYSDSVGFDSMEYTWNTWFDSEKLKKENNLVEACIIRKEAFFQVNGYELREKAVNEDWNFWLKQIAKGNFPVHMNYYGIWYRRKEQGELAKSRENKERALEIIKNTAATITKRVEAIQYPKQDYNWDGIVENVESIKEVTYTSNGKINILMMIPWMVTGGADKFNLDLLTGLDKDKFDITIVTTEPTVNTYRQEFEKNATVYDLTTFLDKKYWTSFINYIIKKNNIDLIFNTNCKFGYSMLPYIKAKYPKIPIVDYIHMEEWYNRNGGYSRDSSMVGSVIDKTLLCNKNSENILIDYFKRNKKDVETVYIGVDEKEFNPENYNKEGLLKEYNINQNGRYIISYICRIADQKRPHLLMQIVKKLKQERKDFLVLVVGEGNMLSSIKAEARRLQLMDNIMFLGNITKTKEIYAISDLTLNCSIKEGVALTSYESLAMGIPVISSDVGGQKELISNDVGVIVPCLQKETEIKNFKYKLEEIQNYVDAINKVLGNLEFYKSNCRKKILDGFTINHMIQKMSNIFENIAKSPNEEKVQNGEGLKNNLEITKELINMSFLANEKEYSWLCDEYNRTFYPNASHTRRSIVKERLWNIPLWRAFIKLLQKLGIIQAVKHLLGRG
ncbi:MAG: glycosyltransferase [Clostridia bacterium]|nr:glycosyltransferase [Clostridia bacterium]